MSSHVPTLVFCTWLSRILLVGTLLFLQACATVGVTQEIPFPGVAPFDRALMAYVRGNLDQALVDLEEAQSFNPDDLRVWALQNAITREQGHGLEPLRAEPPILLADPLPPEQLLQQVLGRNPEIRKSIFDVIAARAQLREDSVSFGPEFSILSRFHPAGIFFRLTQSVLGSLIERQTLMTQSEQELIAAVARYAQVRGTVLHKLITAYVSVLEAQELLAHTGTSLETATELARVAAILSRNGVLPQREFLELRHEAMTIQQEHTNISRQIAVNQVVISLCTGPRNRST